MDVNGASKRFFHYLPPLNVTNTKPFTGWFGTRHRTGYVSHLYIYPSPSLICIRSLFQVARELVYPGSNGRARAAGLALQQLSYMHIFVQVMLSYPHMFV